MKIKIILAALFAAIIAPFASAYADETATPINSLAELTAAVTNAGNYRLESDITLDSHIFTRGDAFSLDLNNHTINCGAYTFVAYQGHLIIRDDSSAKEGKITGTKITLQATAKITLESGTITNTGASTNSPAVNVVASTGEFIMNGGTVSSANSKYYTLVNRNKATINGGTITSTNYYSFNGVSGSVSTINGGTITSNKFAVVSAGETVLNGGKIYSSNSGGYYGQTNSLLTQNGGVIQSDTTGSSSSNILLSKPGATFVMNDGEVITTAFDPADPEGTGGAGITGFKDTEVTINGGTIRTHAQAISGNGSGPEYPSNDGSNFKVTVNGGMIQSDILALYIPQPNGETLITGGTITGRSAIEVRAGKLTVTGGTIIGGDNQYKIEKNTNGSSTENVGISVIQHSTKLPIEVNILGGTISANLPFAESNPLENPQSDIDKISITIGEDDSNNPPVFNSTNSEMTVYSQDFDGFIYGGRFTKNVTSYVAVNHGEIEESDGMIAVYPFHEVSVEQPSEGGTVEVDKTKTLRGMLVTIKSSPAPGYVVKSITVYDENNNQVSVTNNQFYAPNSDTRIVVEFTVENPATTDDTTDYGAFMAICFAALACSISSIKLSRKLV